MNLRFVEKSRLEPGKVMLYRAHRDVHNQLPADETSISINILGASPTGPFRDQYRFDVERGCIDGILNRLALEPLIALAAHYGGEAGGELIERFAERHPSDRVRFMAVKARAASAGGLDARIATSTTSSRRTRPRSRSTSSAPRRAARSATNIASTSSAAASTAFSTAWPWSR